MIRDPNQDPAESLVREDVSIVPLARLDVGQSALISQIVGQADHVHRLEEFGLRGGTRIQMFRRGNPCIIRTAGNKVCIRADELLDVLVEPAN